MDNLKLLHIDEVINGYDLLLIDLWGVVIEGDDTYAGVVDSLNKIMQKKDVIFLTNAPRPSSIVARNLRNWHLSAVTTEKVQTSGDIAREVIQEHQKTVLNGRTPVIFHLGADRNNDLLSSMDYTPTEDINEADVMAMSGYRDDFEDIHEFDELLKQAAKKPNLLNVCSNPDTTIPRHGVVRYCPGYFASIIENHGGKVIYTGKPKASIYDSVFKRKPDIAKDRILMIGDTFETDILGANTAGIHSALVMTGNANNVHGDFDSLDDKIQSIKDYATKTDIIPNHVIKLA